MFDSFLAGQLACLRELTLLLAPNVNSYKRYAAGRSRRRRSPGATTTGRARCGSSATARRCGSRTAPAAPTSTRTWPSRRSSPPASTASTQGLELEPAYEGNAYAATDKPRLPRRYAKHAICSPARAVARAAFGDDVVDHYVNAADVELAAFEAAVTDWERVRGFERL